MPPDLCPQRRAKSHPRFEFSLIPACTYDTARPNHSRWVTQEMSRSNGSAALDSGAVHDANAVLSAELVRLADRAGGIILPLAIDQQTIFVFSGRQGDG